MRKFWPPLNRITKPNCIKWPMPWDCNLSKRHSWKFPSMAIIPPNDMNANACNPRWMRSVSWHCCNKFKMERPETNSNTRRLPFRAALRPMAYPINPPIAIASNDCKVWPWNKSNRPVKINTKPNGEQPNTNCGIRTRTTTTTTTSQIRIDPQQRQDMPIRSPPILLLHTNGSRTRPTSDMVRRPRPETRDCPKNGSCWNPFCPVKIPFLRHSVLPHLLPPPPKPAQVQRQPRNQLARQRTKQRPAKRNRPPRKLRRPNDRPNPRRRRQSPRTTTFPSDAAVMPVSKTIGMNKNRKTINGISHHPPWRRQPSWHPAPNNNHNHNDRPTWLMSCPWLWPSPWNDNIIPPWRPPRRHHPQYNPPSWSKLMP